MDDALEHFGKFLSDRYFAKDRSDSRSHYRPESINSSMRWRLFLGRILDTCLEDDGGINNLSQTWSAWAESVRNRFSQIATECLPVLTNASDRELKPFDKLDGNTFKALSGRKDEIVSHTLAMQTEESHDLRIATIHSAKGKEFDAVLLVSAPDRTGAKGGHWEEWLADAESEYARFAYVASSRPKYYLAWAIPVSEKNDESVERLRALGFVPEELPHIETPDSKK